MPLRIFGTDLHGPCSPADMLFQSAKHLLTGDIYGYARSDNGTAHPIKYYGETLAACWRKVEYYGGRIYRSGELQPDKIMQFTLGEHVFSVCGDYHKVVPRLCDPSKLRRR